MLREHSFTQREEVLMIQPREPCRYGLPRNRHRQAPRSVLIAESTKMSANAMVKVCGEPAESVAPAALPLDNQSHLYT